MTNIFDRDKMKVKPSENCSAKIPKELMEKYYSSVSTKKPVDMIMDYMVERVSIISNLRKDLKQRYPKLFSNVS